MEQEHSKLLCHTSLLRWLIKLEALNILTMEPQNMKVINTIQTDDLSCPKTVISGSETSLTRSMLTCVCVCVVCVLGLLTHRLLPTVKAQTWMHTFLYSKVQLQELCT